MGAPIFSDPRKPCLIEEEVESTSLPFLRVLLKREMSQVCGVNRLVWEMVIFGCL